MRSKKSEAQKCANTLGLLSNKSGKGNIDMNIVAKTDLNFQGIHLQPIANLADTWLTASQIGFALQYADDKAVQRIYSRHADEFTENMTRVVKVTTPYGEQLTRAFSLRGAHLVAMFARTPKAKEFRRWVLDILDSEVERGNTPASLEKLYTMHLAKSELCSMAWLYKSAMHMRNELEFLVPKLEALQSPLAYSANSMAINYVRNLEDVRVIMAREVAKINPEDLAGDVSWDRVLSDLKVH